MNSTMTEGIKYLTTKFPESPEGLTFIQAGVCLGEECGFASLKHLVPITDLIKGLRGAHNFKTALISFDDLIFSFRKCSSECSKDTFFSAAQKTLKCTGSVFGLLKWLGTVGGVAALASRSQFFGSIKSAVTFPLTCYAIVSDIKEFKEKKKIAVAGIVSSLCLIWFDTIATFNPWKTVRPVPPWSIQAAMLLSSSMAVVKKVSKDCKE